MTAPFFSVIVPVYNVEPYLRECVDSILGQTFADFELILVDDGSPDGCPAICEEYAHADRRVSVIHKANGGLVSARNAGIVVASGEYVCHADSDDYVEPGWLQAIHDDVAANGFPDMLVYGYYKDLPDEERIIRNGIAPGLYDKAAMKEKVYPYMLFDRRYSGSGKAGLECNVWIKPGKRVLYAEHALQDQRISVGEDAALTFEVLYAADSVFISDRALYHYRVRPGSITTGEATAKRMSDLMLVYDHLKTKLVDADPVFSRQLNDWYTRQIMFVVATISRENRLVKTVSAVRPALKKTHCLDRIRVRELPRKIQLYMMPMKLHMVSVPVLMQKIMDVIYF